MRVLVVDDHEMVRRGVTSLLLGSKEYDVCGEAADGREALQKAQELKPDVIVMDISMPNLNGLEATRLIRNALPNSEVLIMSQHDSGAMIGEAFKAGARGYVVKSSIGRDLLTALEYVKRHEIFVDQAIIDGDKLAQHIDAQEILQRSAALEQALRESEELYRSTFDSAEVGIAHVNPDGRWLRVNEKLCKILGYRREELVQLTFQEITHPDDLPADLVETDKLRTGAIKTFSMEKRYIRKDGSSVWVNLTVSGARDPNGTLKHFISVVEDIAKRKQIEQALFESQAQLMLALKSSGTAMFEWDLLKRQGKWNEQMEAIYDFTPKSDYITDEEWRGLFHPEDISRLAAEAAVTYANNDKFQFEFRTIKPDGEVRWILSQGRILRDVNGTAARLIGIHTDITEQKKSQQVNALLTAIVNSSDDAIISKNLDGIITSWNKAAERIFGYTPQEAVGKHVTLIIPTDRRDEETQIISRLKRGERIDHFETRRVRKDGTLLDISLTISPVKDGAGNVIGASKVARDITPRREMERALRESEERYRAIVDTTPECVKLVAKDGTLLHMNPPGLAMVGATSSEMVVGKNVYDLIAPHDRDRFRAFNEEICRGGKGSLEFDIVGLNGVAHHMETHAAPLRMPDRSIVQLAVTSNITERVRVQESLRKSEEQLRSLADDLEKEVRTRTKELEQRNQEVLQQSEQLRELSSRLLQTQDDERRHIARELHDSAGQILAALGMNLASMTQQAVKNPLLVKLVDDTQSLVQQLSKEIRTTSYLLHPPLLDENGLSGAIRWYVQGLMERSGLNIDVKIQDDFGRLPSDMELAVFRIIQECLTNIHRHAGSKAAIVRLSRSGGSVVLDIEDEGRGIPAEKLDGIHGSRSGVGITGMRERVRHFNGIMEIHSSVAGTKISVVLPACLVDEAEPQKSLQEVRVAT